MAAAIASSAHRLWGGDSAAGGGEDFPFFGKLSGSDIAANDEGAERATPGASPTVPATATATPSPSLTPTPTSTPTPMPTPFLRPPAPLPPSVVQCGKPLPLGMEPGVATSFEVPLRWQPDRSYRVYLPELVGQGDLPVVLLFHALNGSAAGEETASGFIEVARENGFLLVAPEGSGFPRGWSASNRVPIGPDDVQHVGRVLDQLADDFCIDERRVYATGMSNGAFMASMLGCKLSDRIAAIAPVAGVSFPKTTCGDPVPVLALHGTNDRTVPFGDGRIFRLFSYDGAREGIAGWAGHNGCRYQSDAWAEPWTEGESWSLERYGGCINAAETALIVVDGGGHSWPTGSAEYVWQFFQRHERSPGTPR